MKVKKKSKQKNEKNGQKKLTFGAWRFDVGTLTCTWEEREGKYHINQGNKRNTNMGRITIVQK
jgi:hypothetical protein